MNGVTFGEKHSFKDWGLYLKSRPVISPPMAKTNYYDLPGADGQLDLTEALTGDVKYDMRKITCEFVALNARSRWDMIYSDILDYLQGEDLIFFKDEEPCYIYKGRFQVNDWQSDKKSALLVIEGLVEPYKQDRYSSLEDWVWDTFRFEDGVIREYKDIEIDGEYSMEIPGARMKVIPTFTVASEDEAGLTMTCNGKSYDLVDGANIVPYIEIDKNGVLLEFTGKGTVSIEYRGGRL